MIYFTLYLLLVISIFFGEKMNNTELISWCKLHDITIAGGLEQIENDGLSCRE